MIDRQYETDSKYDPDRSKTQWQRFEKYVNDLNSKAPDHISYKVLYLGRHGEGYHNVAERYYGTPEWDVRDLLLIKSQTYGVPDRYRDIGRSLMAMGL